MRTHIELGHQGKYWDDSYKELPYIKVPPIDQEYNQYLIQGYDPKYVKSFVGYMYNNSNPMPEWINRLENSFGLYKQTYTFYRMDSCEIMPTHVDHYQTYCKLNNVTPDQVWRVVMMLEDWKPGHYFELDGVGYTNWKAGDWFKWRGDVPHAASNIGVLPRYTIQITGLDPLQGQLNNLFAFNIPDMQEERNHPLINIDVVPIINPNDDKNYHYMVYMNNRHIRELEQLNHATDIRELLNAEGLHIYLYEPLSCYRYPFTEHTQGFYSEFDTIDKTELRAEELDSIYDYVIRNKLTNVKVHTCDYDVKNWYVAYFAVMDLMCDDLFLRTQKSITNVREKPSNEFIYNYICLNWRFTKHRQLVSSFLAGRGGHLSWYFKADFDTLNKDLFFNLNSWEQKYPELYNQLKSGCDFINENAPLCVDINASTANQVVDPLHVDMWPDADNYDKGVTPSLYNNVSNHLSSYYFETFIDIVNETRYAQPTANISEKTFQPIQYFRPFILVAPPKSLEHLKSLGFKTFNDFFDESYDDELDHGERLAKIFIVLNKILSMSNQEQREMYSQMIPVLQHNFNTYKKFVK